MDDELRRQIGQLFGDAPPAPAPPARPSPESLNEKRRAARAEELARLDRQDRAVAEIRALADAAGIEVTLNVPPSPLRLKEARAGRRGRREE